MAASASNTRVQMEYHLDADGAKASASLHHSNIRYNINPPSKSEILVILRIVPSQPLSSSRCSRFHTLDLCNISRPQEGCRLLIKARFFFRGDGPEANIKVTSEQETVTLRVPSLTLAVAILSPAAKACQPVIVWRLGFFGLGLGSCQSSSSSPSLVRCSTSSFGDTSAALLSPCSDALAKPTTVRLPPVTRIPHRVSLYIDRKRRCSCSKDRPNLLTLRQTLGCRTEN